MLVFHQKSQFDILPGGIENPILVIGWQVPGEYRRLFCLWKGGVWLRWIFGSRLCIKWIK